MENRGYAQRVILANKKANAKNFGVKLGRYCIGAEVPVREIAEELGVSRMTIYKWFVGEADPREHHVEQITHYLRRVGFIS